MSKITKEINRISIAVISLSGKLVFYALVIVLLYLGAKRGYEFGHSIFDSPGVEAAPGTNRTIVLEGDETVGEVAAMLEDAGLILDRSAFTIQAYCYEYEVNAGTYVLNTSQSSKELIGILKDEPNGELES